MGAHSNHNKELIKQLYKFILKNIHRYSEAAGTPDSLSDTSDFLPILVI